MTNQIIVVDPLERPDILRALASEVRVRILEHLTRKGPCNVNQVAEELDLPQSTVSSNSRPASATRIRRIGPAAPVSSTRPRI